MPSFASVFGYWFRQILSPDADLKAKYEAFKNLLEHDRASHELIAELEGIRHSGRRVDVLYVERLYNELSDHVAAIIRSLQKMQPTRREYADMEVYFKKIDAFGRYFFGSSPGSTSPPYILRLSEITDEHVSLVGGKAFQLARVLHRCGAPVPEGFVITTNAFRYFLRQSGLLDTVRSVLARLDPDDPRAVEEEAARLVRAVLDAALPSAVEGEINAATEELAARSRRNDRLAVRSSAVAEDSDVSFAGQYESVLNVSPGQILQAYKRVVASKYSARGLTYRIRSGLSDEETAMAVLVLPMIHARCSGVAYSHDPSDPAASSIVIHSVWGLGELLVSGKASPDVVYVKRDPPHGISRKRAGGRKHKAASGPDGSVTVMSTSPDERMRSPLDDPTALELARWVRTFEDLFHGPVDVEWSLDEQRTLFILQCRPLPRASAAVDPEACRIQNARLPVRLRGGRCASPGIGSGPVAVVTTPDDLYLVPPRAVLVLKYASPDYARALDRVSAVVTDVGSTAGHFASVARELGVPLITDAQRATAILEPGEIVTVWADSATVFAGTADSETLESCRPRQHRRDTPFARILGYVLRFVSPLNLKDPAAPSFSPGRCRSFHDIVRYCHEKAVQEMFAIGSRRFTRKRGARRLIWPIPMLCYVLDVGNAIRDSSEDRREVPIEAVASEPLQALWQGLSADEIRWGGMSHFNWAEYDKAVMSGGIVRADSAQFASFVVVGPDYVNLNLKFGYHFVIVDALAAPRMDENYILFRFTGGGADFHQRALRAEFLKRILKHLGFAVNVQGDLVEAQVRGEEQASILEKLKGLGRLLGATRLMDMYLHDATSLDRFVEDYLAGRAYFGIPEA